VMSLFINGFAFLLLIFYNVYSLRLSLKKIGLLFFKRGLVLLGLVHFSACFFFAFFLDRLDTIKDPHDFYEMAAEATNWFEIFGFGHNFISFTVYPLVKLGFAIELLFFLFATISFKGFLILSELLQSVRLSSLNKFLFLFFLLPTIHIWTAMFGKEALLFFAGVLLLKKMGLKKYDSAFIISLLLFFFIRPHAFFVLLFSVLFVIYLDSTSLKKTKQIIFGVCVLSVFVFLPASLLFFLKIDQLDPNSIIAFKEFLLDFGSKAGGSTPISIHETTIFSRIGYLLLMPLPFIYELNSKVQYLAAFENIYYLTVFICVGINFIKHRFSYNNLSNDLKFALISSLLMILLFASYLYNLGLGNRMRIMFLPYLFYFLIKAIGFKSFKA